MQIPSELKFIEDAISLDYENTFIKADWLLSPFESNKWIYNFEFKKNKKIDWNIELYDGSKLTDDKNHNLLISLKYWLVSSTNRNIGPPVSSNKVQASMLTMVRDFNAVIKIIDYLLLNGEKYKLIEFGLGAITYDDLSFFLDKAYSSNKSSESLYNWSSLVSNHLTKTLTETNKNDVIKFILDYPTIKNIDQDTINNCPLEIPEEQHYNIISAMILNKLAIQKKGTSKKNQFGGTWGINTSLLSKLIYKNTLFIKSITKPSFPSLEVNFEDEEIINREYKGIKVTTKDSSLLSWGNLLEYRRGLEKLRVLNVLGLPSPGEDEINKLELYNPEIFIKKGRYKTVPYEIIFNAIKEAIEFHLKVGNIIIDSLCDIIRYSYKKGISLTSLTNQDVITLLPPELTTLGISSLGITCLTSGNIHASRRGAGIADYYHRLRSNQGLLDLVHVYYGAVKVVVGALTARRDGELLDLMANNCLDNTEEWLIFENRKSSKMLYGARSTEARPIDPIAVDMIKNLVKLQSTYIEVGFIDDFTNLFSPPHINSPSKLRTSKRCADTCVDLFCDYIQTYRNNEGERYYLRQHQLRRFFALLFFYSSRIGGLETLQWMLGHTEPEHIWHYITESTQGAVLLGAKAQYVAESLVNGGKDYKNLTDFVYEKFNTTEFSILDIEELEEYIEELIQEGNVTIEPEFFVDGNKKRMRIITKIIEVNDAK